jgi:hypothetical protein
MPLFDHFHRPLSETHQWVSFHGRWATAIADDLNRRLPKRFLAEAPFNLGPFASADVAEVDQARVGGNGPADGLALPGSGGGVGVAAEPVLYTPPETDLSMPAQFPEDILVEVRDLQHARQVLAVIELVSPGNKDDTDARESFAGKCLSYLAKGMGLVVIDIVSDRLANLHNVLIRHAAKDAKLLMAGEPPLYVAAYRPVHREKKDVIDLWTWPLVIGSALPSVPLALKGYGCVRLDLEATYSEACERSRIPG